MIAGTDTGVGKTQVARALCALLAARGLKPCALKPAETGCAPDSPEDALLLRAACGPPHDALPLERVCPYRFRLPAAPLVAADAEGASIDVLRIERLVSGAPGPVVVELAGGLLVPFAREVVSDALEQADSADRAPPRHLVTNLDLAERLGLPVVLVGRAGLGTLNHCALSAQALEARGLRLAAIVLNRATAADDPSVESNPKWVEELTSARVLGPSSFEADAGLREIALGRLLAPLLSEELQRA